MAERIDTGGLGAALLAVLGAQGGVVDETGGQVDLFGNEDAPLPLPSKGVSGPKGGRPAGARNRSTEAWVSMFLAQHRAPLMVMGNIASQDLRELHGMLQDMADARTRKKYLENGTVEEVRVLVDPLAVLKLQRDTAVALAPYIHKQQPKALEIDTRQRGIVLLGDLAEAESGVSDDLALPLAPIEENHEVSRDARQQSDVEPVGQGGNGSNGNPLEWQEH